MVVSPSPNDDRAPVPAIGVHWEDLFRVVDEFVAAAQPPVILMAPFINAGVLSRLLSHQSVAVVVTSWRRDHLLQGVSTLDVYPIVRDAGAKLVVNDRLHAKLVTADFKDSLIGSANFTPAGMGLAPRSNLEAMVRVTQATPELKALFCRILIDGRPIDDEIHARYVEWLKRLPPPPIAPPADEDGPPRMERDPFLISNLPATRSPSALWAEANAVDALSDDAIHDLQLFRVDPSMTEQDFLLSLRTVVAANPFVGRLIARIPADGLYFGAFKQLVQQTCTDVPMPHRRDLTALVQNLYGWIAEVFSDAFEVRRPNYSQLIRPIR